MFPLGAFAVPRSFRHAHDMPRVPDDARRAIGRAVEVRMGELRHGPASLADVADVDPKTVRDLVSGARWPRLGSRTRIEEALGWGIGTIQAMADGVLTAPADSDPVVVAIEASGLTRANKAKLLGMYYELLDGQDKGVRGA